MVSAIQGTSQGASPPVSGVNFQAQTPAQDAAVNNDSGKGSASKAGASSVGGAGGGSAGTAQASSSSTTITSVTSVTNSDGSVATTTTYADGTTSTSTSLPDHTKASYAYEEQQKLESGAGQTQNPGGSTTTGGNSGKTDFLV